MEAYQNLPGWLPLVFPVYAVWLLFTGEPLFWQRARTIYSRPVILHDIWFRYAGGLSFFGYGIGFFLPEITSSYFLFYILEFVALFFYFGGLWRALSPKAR